ncbi:immunoglobulin iota chain [Ochotona princeps]|uniref:immunoglobulin iota chain n=1 Tax=Ochotona princeps TaxID=9978 RepID=UPI0027154599|nr:immunoglobulin iota chain [Ochotona princeps]
MGRAQWGVPLRAGRGMLAWPGALAAGHCTLQVATMSWTPVLLLLLAHCTGGDPQPALHQPPAVSSALGTTVRLSCTLSRDHRVALHSIYWYQQKPGHPPRFLLRYLTNANQERNPQLPPRFSGSKDLDSNRGYLTISDLRPEDEAVYFCAVGSLENEMEKREEEQPAASGSWAPWDSSP